MSWNGVHLEDDIYIFASAVKKKATSIEVILLNSFDKSPKGD
jgi:hypothetical protein